jgi:transposase, IS6 family
VLQLYSHPVVGWPDAPPGLFGMRPVQVASIRAGGHPLGSGMVFALLAFVPRRRGAIGRAWALGGSRHRLALGPAVRPGVGSARLRKRLKATNDSWRVDETYVRVKGKWVYFYRAVDSTGATIDFLLSAKRDAAAAERFLTKALGGENHPAPRVINTDKHAAYPPAIVELKDDGVLEEKCTHRLVQYLNNVLEQDHRAIKRRVRASQHFRSFWGAWRTIAGYEAIHMIRKGQAYGSAAGAKVGLVHRFILGLFAATN